MASGGDDDALRKAFKAWDKNGDGYIDRSEIREVFPPFSHILSRCFWKDAPRRPLGFSLSFSKVLAAAGVPEAKLDKMTQEVVDKTDTNKDGRISFEEFALFNSSFFFWRPLSHSLS